MRINVLKVGSTTCCLLLSTLLSFGQQANNRSDISLNNFSAFKNQNDSWSIVGNVNANLNQANTFTSTKGEGVLLNLPSKGKTESDILTVQEYGDMVLELEYMVAKGANSAIFLQGVYGIKIEDSWGLRNPLASNNGGINQRWDDAKPEGEKGYEGFAPRQNASKAPGLWQKIKIDFQAPKFDASGIKTQNAKIHRVELNGVLIHENIELTGVTKGAVDKEKPLASLRLQGGDVAFRNIKISALPEIKNQGDDTDPIYVEAKTNNMIRSFIDVAPGQRSVHAISVGGPEQVNFSYDLDNGTILQGWHGGFIDATPMWHNRGNGTSRPLGSVVRFTQQPLVAIAKLANSQDKWLTDTTGTGFKTKGYVMDSQDRPEFKYHIYGAKVTDAVKVLENGQGLSRELTVEQPHQNLYLLLAVATDIEEISKGLYLLNDKSYYIRLDDSKTKPIIRDVDGKKQMIMPIGDKLSYTILF